MSTLKKVISLVLCAAILVGSFALVGNIAPVASAAEETPKIDSYADLVAKYGQNGDGFVYAGIEFYESNGKLTDYYVKSGDELTVRVYVKSNMFIGETYVSSFYENSFFDVKLAGGPNASLSNGYTSNYGQGTINAKHPAKINNNAGHTITAIQSASAGWLKNVCGYTADYLKTVDMVKSNTKTDITKSINAYDATSDEWLFEYYVKIQPGLADGTEGNVTSPIALWHAAINSKTGKHDARRQSYIPVITPEKQAAGSVTFDDTTTMAAAMDSGVIDYFVSEDLEHTFTIGEPPAGGDTPEEVKITATFIAENQTDIIETKEFVVGTELEFPASVENQIGWAIVKEAMATPGTLLEPDADGNYAYTVKDADVTFLRVLSATKFPVDISLDAKASEITPDLEKLEAAGVEYIAEKAVLRVMLSIGESFDLSTIEDAFAKAGNEFGGWDITATAPSTVEGTVITLNTVNGELDTAVTLSSKVTWNPELYTVNFYLNKDAAEPIFTKENVKYGDAVQYGAITNAISDKKFAGWYNSANDEFISAANNYSFVINGDLDVYAAWSDYANIATFMVRDYANSEWVEISKFIDKNEAETATVSEANVKSAIAAACTDANITLQGVYTSNPDENADSKVNGILQLAPGVYQATALTYSGHQTYYIATTLACEVTWMIPAYDAETNTFDDANATVAATDKVATAAYAGAADPYSAASKFNKSIEIPTGYALAYWKDAATGEKVEFNENGAYVVAANTRTATLIAVFELVEYTVAFNLRNSATADILIMTSTVSLGDEIAIDGAEFTLNGEATVLPEIGLDNEDQADGGYELLEGYKFAGWSFGTDSNAEAIEFPAKLTADVIKRNFANGVININAMWEAEDFVLTFYITNAAGEEELFATYNVKVGSDIATYRNVTEEIAAAINEKAPEGKVFSNIWYNKETNAPDTSLTKMPAKDVSYYANYKSASVSVYVDYNYLPEKNLEETMKLFKVEGKELLLFGADITEVKEEAPYLNRSFETIVMRSVNSNNSPETPSEIIGWNIYHIAANEDPYTAEWKAGVNDEGSTIAQTTIIFQPVWKAHKDMMFRFHDTDGDIYFAVGKDFSFHYWNKGVIVDKYGDTVINTNPEENIVLFYTISIDWSAFSIRLDAFPIPKYIFTPDGFIAFFQMIPELIKSLLG